jgi:hypothetical protein
MRLTLALLLATLTAVATPAAAADKTLDDLLFDLQLVPLAGQVPASFALERLGDGQKTTLAEQRGQVVMLYFWATW